MTNEEKAKSLVGCPTDVSINKWNGEEYNKLGFEYAMEMAEWKDQQLKEYLEKKKQEYEIERGTLRFSGDVIEKIINELFNEE